MNHHSLLNWVLLLIIALFWGSTFILIKMGLAVFSPYQVTALRVALAGICLFPFLIYHRNNIERAKLKYFLVIALSGHTICTLLLTTAQMHISSSVTGILNSLTPLSTLVLGALVFNAHFTKRRLTGVMLGLCGAAFLMMQKNYQTHDNQYPYALLVVLATVGYAISSNTIKTHLHSVSAVIINTVALCLVAPFAIIYLLSTNFVQQVSNSAAAQQAVGYVSLMAITGTAFSSILYYRLTQQTDPLFSSTVTYLLPIVALFWGFMDGEIITPYHLIGTLIILAGVYLVK